MLLYGTLGVLWLKENNMVKLKIISAVVYTTHQMWCTSYTTLNGQYNIRTDGLH